jgi:hypothetical protein
MPKIWLSISVSIAVCSTLLLTLEHYATQPRTHREAVMQILDQRDIPYVDVQVANACTFDPRDCAFLSTYAAYVTVMTPQTLHGQLVCQRLIDGSYWDTCALSLEALELHAIPLPSLSREPLWLATLKRLPSRIATWLRKRTVDSNIWPSRTSDR